MKKQTPHEKVYPQGTPYSYPSGGRAPHEKVLDILDSLNISYDFERHPAAYTMEEIDALKLTRPNESIAKNLFLRDGSGKRHFLVLVAGDKTVDLKKLRQTIGSSRLSFASEERLIKHLKVTKGSVSPMGILNDDDLAVEVFIDEALKDSVCIGVHPNDNTATVWISCKDLEQVIRCHGNPLSYIPV